MGQERSVKHPGAADRSVGELVKKKNGARAQIGPYIRVEFLNMGLYPYRLCQYMEGMEIGPICGKPSIPNYSYCRKHKEECYVPPRSRKKEICYVLPQRHE